MIDFYRSTWSKGSAVNRTALVASTFVLCSLVLVVVILAVAIFIAVPPVRVILGLFLSILAIKMSAEYIGDKMQEYQKEKSEENKRISEEEVKSL